MRDCVSIGTTCLRLYQNSKAVCRRIYGFTEYLSMAFCISNNSHGLFSMNECCGRRVAELAVHLGSGMI